MITIYDIIGTTRIHAGQTIEGGFRLFGTYQPSATGKVTEVREDYLELSGHYDIDQMIGEYKICGEGEFSGVLQRKPDGNWEAKGSVTGLYYGHDVINGMRYSYEKAYHVFEGTAGGFIILSKLWSETVTGRATLCIYSKISPETVVLPSFYISFY